MLHLQNLVFNSNTQLKLLMSRSQITFAWSNSVATSFLFLFSDFTQHWIQLTPPFLKHDLILSSLTSDSSSLFLSHLMIFHYFASKFWSSCLLNLGPFLSPLSLHFLSNRYHSLPVNLMLSPAAILTSPVDSLTACQLYMSKMEHWIPSSSKSVPLPVFLISVKTMTICSPLWEKHWKSSLIHPFHLSHSTYHQNL